MRHKHACRANPAYSSYFGCNALTINPGLSLFWAPCGALIRIGRRRGLVGPSPVLCKIARGGLQQPPLGGNGSHVQSDRALSGRNCPQIGGRNGTRWI